MLRLSIIFVVLLIFPFSVLGAKSFSLLDDSPASFFGSGIEGYYFKDGGLGVFHYKNDKLYHGITKDNISEITNGEENLIDIVLQSNDVIINKNGSIRLLMNHDDYSCVGEELSNCIYSDMLIKSVTVQNILGKDKKISTIADVIKEDTAFSLGSKLYSFQVVTSIYNFNDFNDFDAVICSKSETGDCRTVIFEDILDLAALFELYNVNSDLYDIDYERVDDNISYIFDFKELTVTPYSTSCVENFESLSGLANCRIADLPEGNITYGVHKKGINYWRVSYNNNKFQDKFFWIDGEKRPYKAYTNSVERADLSLFNKIAMEAILKSQ